MNLRFLPASTEAVLAELPDLTQTLDLLATLQAALHQGTLTGVRELVPAARTLLIHFDPQQIGAPALCRAITRLPLAQRDAASGARIEIPVHYDGEDLAEVATLLGIGVPELIARHTGQDWRVAFCGFAPGFAYLTGGHPSLDVPRRASPRVRVPAGSVALAGTFSAVYPAATPGGWQLLGTTDLAMWDLARAPPALLRPGMRVRFVDVTTQARASQPALARPPAIDSKSEQPSGPALIVKAPGLQTLIQDAGRPGLAMQGVSASGALDQGALRRANRLVGNAPGQPVLEALAGGLLLQSVGRTSVAVTGAAGPVTLTGANGSRRDAARDTALALDDGDTLKLGWPTHGLRSYVALHGGFAVAPVLGSASFDTLARIGPPPLASGQRLQAGHSPAESSHAPLDGPTPLAPKAGDTVTLDIVLGPRTDWFTREAVALLTGERWQITSQIDRIGLRLAGARPLARSKPQELPSEGVVTGAIQVPANGQPLVFLADHPLTGGYPVIACIAPYHLDLAGQLPPGAWLRFRPLAPFAEVKA